MQNQIINGGFATQPIVAMLKAIQEQDLTIASLISRIETLESNTTP